MDLFACSGPGAGRAIHHSIEIGYAHAAMAGGLLLVSLAAAALGTRRAAMPAVLTGLLALHPAWTISAYSGDCGMLKRDASWAFTALGCVVLFWQVARDLWSLRAAHRPERRQSGQAAAPDRVDW